MRFPAPVFLSLLFLAPALLWAQDEVLSVEQCRTLAVQNHPLQQKKANAANITALQLDNIKSNNLPRVAFGAQASWQSDVFGLPIKFPGSEIPTVPKDQYKISADVGERIWDGGSDRILRQQKELERDLTVAQSDVDAFQVREVVTDLYFKALLLQENVAILESSKTDLEQRLKQVEALVKEGVALRTSADQVRIQILKTDQQIAAAKADQQTLKSVLATWIGRQKTDFTLQKTPVAALTEPTARPEYQLFDLQQRMSHLSRDALKLRMQPRVEAFAQTGLGNPNPFNFFEKGFQPFLLLGVRAQWTPVDWGNRKRDAQVFELQMKNVDAQRQAFQQRLDAGNTKDSSDVAKYQAQLSQDDAIITLQQDIVQRADAQVKNGVMTTTDYLTQINLLTQSKLTRSLHEIQALQAIEMLKARQ